MKYILFIISPFNYKIYNLNRLIKNIFNTNVLKKSNLLYIDEFTYFKRIRLKNKIIIIRIRIKIKE